MPVQHITELFALDGREFITEAYRNLLKREPDEHGMAYYLGRLAQGYGKAAVITQLAQSPECKPLNGIKGIKNLIALERRSNSWLFNLFNRRPKIEKLLELSIYKLENISQILKSRNEELNALLREVTSSPTRNIQAQSTNADEDKANGTAQSTATTSCTASEINLLNKRINRAISNKNNLNTIFIDVTTLLKWTRPPVGIIRTLFEIVRYSLNYSTQPVEYFIFNNTKDRIRLVDPEIIESLLYSLEDPRVNGDFKIKSLAIARETLDFDENIEINPSQMIPYSYDGLSILLEPSILLAKNLFCPFRSTDTVISIGLDWDSSNYRLLHELKIIHHFKFVGAFYDGIPINKPEFLPNKDFCGMFFDYFCQLSQISDKIFTISNKSRNDYISLIEKEKIPGTRNIKNIRLGDPKIRAASQNYKNSRSLDGPFVIYVSTIEKRKNHILLFKIWKKLHEKFGNKTPTLICIGMWGWGVDELKEKHQSDLSIQKVVKFFDDVDDDELVWFYKNASFAVFPSHDEGWGLGASESLTYSLPCITSSTPALLEATQNLMPYCDPNDQDQWIETIEKLITNEDYLKSLKKIAAESYIHRSWEDFSEDFFEFATTAGEK